MRKKLSLLSEQDQESFWSAELCAQWMGADPDQAAVLYVDGHVWVYHGHQTQLPRHYVARQKLCLRATTDYWVNAMDGQPFFLLNQAVDPGMLQVLEHEIVPRLEREIPNRPTPEQLEADARSLLRALYSTEADLLADENTGTSTVRVHHQANRCGDEVIRHLCTELNQTETNFPGTILVWFINWFRTNRTKADYSIGWHEASRWRPHFQPP